MNSSSLLTITQVSRDKER